MKNLPAGKPPSVPGKFPKGRTAQAPTRRRRAAYFYRTHASAEIDLLLEKGGLPDIAVEIKRSSAPSPAKGFAQACDDLRITQRYVVYPGSEKFALRHGAQAISLAELVGLLHAESVV